MTEPAPVQSDPPSRWKTLLDFLWAGGYRSTIVFTVMLGAIWITIDSNRICMVPPQTSAAGPADRRTGDSQPEQSQPRAEANLICTKYFELAFMVVGGYLGLSLPGGNRYSDAASDPVAGRGFQDPTSPPRPPEKEEPVTGTGAHDGEPTAGPVRAGSTGAAAAEGVPGVGANGGADGSSVPQGGGLGPGQPEPTARLRPDDPDAESPTPGGPA